MTPLVLTILALALIAALPFLAEALRQPVAVARRKRPEAKIVDLPDGAVHYRWSGSADGPVAVCIHGLSTPSYVFAATERSLAALGYRVLSYDLYGRGLSDRAPGPQSAEFFLIQLRSLLRHLHVTGSLTVIGFSMGAQIAAAFAGEEGARIKALVLVAPAGLSPRTRGERSALWTLPWIGGWLTRVAGGWALRRELVEHRTTPTVIPDLEDRQAAETRTRGFLPAILSSRRHLLAAAMGDDLTRVSQNAIPVLAIWGVDDPVVPLTAMGTLSRSLPGAHHVQISGAGHNLLQTHPAQVADALKEFL